MRPGPAGSFSVQERPVLQQEETQPSLLPKTLVLRQPPLTPDATWDWIFKIESSLNDTHQVLWPSGPEALWSATLTTGLDGKGASMFDCTEEDWRKALASGSIETYQQFLAERGLSPSDNPLKATASEHGFTPLALLPWTWREG